MNVIPGLGPLVFKPGSRAVVAPVSLLAELNRRLGHDRRAAE
jgi:hypothetical protein